MFRSRSLRIALAVALGASQVFPIATSADDYAMTYKKMYETGVVADIASPTAGPFDPYIAAEPGGDALVRFAPLLQPQYFPGRSIAQVVRYLEDRFANYEKIETALGQPAWSLDTSCDYAAESMYAVVSHVDIGPGKTRTNIRGTCVLLAKKAEVDGRLSAGMRGGLIQYFAVVGGGYRDFERRYSESGDVAARDRIELDASETFKLLFEAEVADTPPEKFPCVLAEPGFSCDKILRDVTPYFARIVAKLP